MRLAHLVTTAVLLAAATSPLGAQSAATPRTTVLSVQPLGLIFEFFSAEIEHALKPSMTVGLGGSYWNGTGVGIRYTSGDLKLRYYPEGRALQGFAFGGQVGYTSITGQSTSPSTATSEATVSGPTIGVGLDYNWLLGASNAFYVGLGLGAKRLFVNTKDVEDVSGGYPTARVSVGYAF